MIWIESNFFSIGDKIKISIDNLIYKGTIKQISAIDYRIEIIQDDLIVGEIVIPISESFRLQRDNPEERVSLSLGITKAMIKRFVRMVADKPMIPPGMPWIISEEYRNKYEIVKDPPSNLIGLISNYLEFQSRSQSTPSNSNNNNKNENGNGINLESTIDNLDQDQRDQSLQDRDQNNFNSNFNSNFNENANNELGIGNGNNVKEQKSKLKPIKKMKKITINSGKIETILEYPINDDLLTFEESLDSFNDSNSPFSSLNRPIPKPILIKEFEDLLMSWTFLQCFQNLLFLSSFPFDHYCKSIIDYGECPNPIWEEIVFALLKVIREEIKTEGIESLKSFIIHPSLQNKEKLNIDIDVEISLKENGNEHGNLLKSPLNLLSTSSDSESLFNFNSIHDSKNDAKIKRLEQDKKKEKTGKVERESKRQKERILQKARSEKEGIKRNSAPVLWYENGKFPLFKQFSGFLMHFNHPLKGRVETKYDFYQIMDKLSPILFMIKMITWMLGERVDEMIQDQIDTIKDIGNQRVNLVDLKMELKEEEIPEGWSRKKWEKHCKFLRIKENRLLRRIDKLESKLNEYSMLRIRPLGMDRNKRIYWYLNCKLYVQEQGKETRGNEDGKVNGDEAIESKWFYYDDIETISKSLISWLNPKGERELDLRTKLLDLIPNMTIKPDESDKPLEIVVNVDSSSDLEFIKTNKKRKIKSSLESPEYQYRPIHCQYKNNLKI